MGKNKINYNDDIYLEYIKDLKDIKFIKTILNQYSHKNNKSVDELLNKYIYYYNNNFIENILNDFSDDFTNFINLKIDERAKDILFEKNMNIICNENINDIIDFFNNIIQEKIDECNNIKIIQLKPSCYKIILPKDKAENIISYIEMKLNNNSNLHYLS